MPLAKKQHKFNAKPTTVDGIRFASQKEARRYSELRLLEKAGQIYGLELQPLFQLTAHDCKIAKYRADFAYCRRDARGAERVIEDVKGMRTPVYRLKKKLFEAQYGITIREI